MDSGTLTGAPAASTERAPQGGGREAGSLGQQSKGTVSGLRQEGHRPRAESLMKASARVGDARPWAEGTLPLSPRPAAHRAGAGAGIPPAADGEPLGPPGVVCAPRWGCGEAAPTEALGSGEPGAAAPGTQEPVLGRRGAPPLWSPCLQASWSPPALVFPENFPCKCSACAAPWVLLSHFQASSAGELWQLVYKIMKTLLPSSGGSTRPCRTPGWQRGPRDRVRERPRRGAPPTPGPPFSA